VIGLSESKRRMVPFPALARGTAATIDISRDGHASLISPRCGAPTRHKKYFGHIKDKKISLMSRSPIDCAQRVGNSDQACRTRIA
jgi:uncharacterized C2H2 Zn-finger protein